MTRPSSFAQHLLADDLVEPCPAELDLLLAEDRIAVLTEALELQREYMAGLAEAQSAAAWAEAERDAVREQLAAERAGYAADVAELLAANTELTQRAADAETARDLAASDLRGALGVIELGLDASELAA
jgi:hypothetical protein